MKSSDGGGKPPMIWCTLVPREHLRRFSGHEDELSKINSSYDDWRAKMRDLPGKDADAGMLLDRIRMLMISIGVSVPHNRALVETVQGIVVEKLRERAFDRVTAIPVRGEQTSWVKKTLNLFFEKLRFTRDVIPKEVMREAANEAEITSNSRAGILSSVLGSFRGQKQNSKQKPKVGGLISIALPMATEILRELYGLLLSVDPWGERFFG